MSAYRCDSALVWLVRYVSSAFVNGGVWWGIRALYVLCGRWQGRLHYPTVWIGFLQRHLRRYRFLYPRGQRQCWHGPRRQRCKMRTIHSTTGTHRHTYTGQRDRDRQTDRQTARFPLYRSIIREENMPLCMYGRIETHHSRL